MIPTSGHDFQDSTNYEIVLTVTDSTGLAASTSVTVYPEKVNLAFDSVPSGLTISIDGVNKQTPFVLDEVIGFQHTISALAQTSGSTSYAFANWSDGGAQTHGIVAPTTDQSYVATFTAQSSGLVAAYAFNEVTGTTVADVSGNGNTGTLSGATWSTSGKYANALSFNGSSALVSVADSASLDLTTGMTLEAWVNPSSTSGAWRDVIYKSNDIYYLEGSSPQGQSPAMGGTFSPSPLYGTAALAANTWSHLAATYDGTTMRLYVNGTQVASQAQTGTIQTSTGAFSIGGDSLYGQYFAGLIDEIRIYNRALSAGEIQTDMNTPVGSPLQLASAAIASSAVAAPLTTLDVQPLLDEEVARWQAALAAADRALRFPEVRVEIAGLPDRLPGVATANTLLLNLSAAGQGWFLDSAGWEDSGFTAGVSNRPAADQADLPSLLAYELGPMIVLSEDTLADPDHSGILEDLLPPGARRVERGSAVLRVHDLDAVWAQFAADDGALFRNCNPPG